MKTFSQEEAASAGYEKKMESAFTEKLHVRTEYKLKGSCCCTLDIYVHIRLRIGTSCLQHHQWGQC